MSGAKFADRRMGTLSRKAAPVLPYALLRTDNRSSSALSLPRPTPHPPFCQVVRKDRDVGRCGGDSAWEVRDRVKGARREGRLDGVYRFLSRARLAHWNGTRLPVTLPHAVSRPRALSKNRNREPSREIVPRRCPSRRIRDNATSRARRKMRESAKDLREFIIPRKMCIMYLTVI